MSYLHIHLLVFIFILNYYDSIGAQFMPAVSYMAFSSTGSLEKLFNAKNNTYPTRVLTELMNADDSPFARIDLPFPFNFFGRKYYSLYASPNGFLQENSVQPCACSCFYDVPLCTFNSSYFGIIAGFLTDLDPSSSGKDSNITVSIHENFVRVHYQNIPIFGAGIGSINSFYINLFS